MSDWIKNGALVIISCVFAIYLLNAGLVVMNMTALPKAVEVAREKGIAFDERSVREVIRDYRAEGKEVEPLVFPYLFRSSYLEIDGEPVLPLSAMSNTDSPHCNEYGEYYTYQTDELGFNNPRGTHAGETFDVALLGDSYAFGLCAPPTDSITAWLSRQGLTALNLGHGGNGPLIELATLTEYGLSKDVKNYIWLICARNDLNDILNELKSKILLNYLKDPDFRQDGLREVAQLDAALKAYADKEYVREPVDYGKVFMDILLLRSLRSRFNLAVFEEKKMDYVHGAAMLGEVLAEARDRIEKNGSNLLVVYLPYLTNPDANRDKRELIVGELEKHGFDYLDLAQVFARYENPKQFLPMEWDGHFTPEGYAVLAQAMYEALQQRGWLDDATR